MQSKGLSRVFSNTTVQKHQFLMLLKCSAFFMVQLSHPYITTGKTIALIRWTFVGKVMSLLLNMLSRLVITFLPRSKRLLILWLQSPSAVIQLCYPVHGCELSCFSQVQLFATLWTIVRQTPLSTGFSKQEYWSRLPCPPPGDLPDPGIKLVSLKSPALAGRFLTTSTTWEAPPTP